MDPLTESSSLGIPILPRGGKSTLALITSDTDFPPTLSSVEFLEREQESYDNFVFEWKTTGDFITMTMMHSAP